MELECMAPSDEQVRRELRIIGILDAAERSGLVPMDLVQLHTAAYLADALAPVWGAHILDPQLLKRSGAPMSPDLQVDIDRLVGVGVVDVFSVRHRQDTDGKWQLDASYGLNRKFAAPILDAVSEQDLQDAELRFVREVVYAMAGLPSMADAVTRDASYGDALIDDGGLVDIASHGDQVNITAQVALRFGELMRERDVTLTPAEMVHLYGRELDRRASSAG
jgi:hypothetical protein